MLHNKKNILSILTVFFAMVFLALPASAHVTVKPATSTTEAWETYSIKIPVEKDIPTTKIVLKIPENLEFKMYEPVEGWKTTTEKDNKDKVTTVTWETANDDAAIQPGQYRTFTFTAQNPSEAEKVAWDAFQYYKDGSIVEWTGDENSELPHSITDIVKSEMATDSHGHSHNTTANNTEEKSAHDQEEGTSLSTVLSIIAIIVSIAAIIVSFVKRK
ncbi:YcnI family copper-binding membrane protein [Niallia sp. 03133]|uniref:YcnI family copper-binding membrane protein n=1 Tax=Niallia sp. 03133 TaxID=3458060 RepID=UPI004044895B